MKNILILFMFLTIRVGIAQCNTPTNLSVSTPYPTAVQLSWTENGTATVWEVAVVPDFYVGAPIPTTGYYAMPTNPFILTGLPPAYGCYAFFVRSVCSLSSYSSWTAVGSSGCSTNVYAYLNTLSNANFSLEDYFSLSPVPAKDFINITNNQQVAIKSISVYNMLGQLVQTFINPSNTIDVSNLKSGSYILKMTTENGVLSSKFLKE